MKLFGLGYGKIDTFFFLHREIIKTLEVVFDGYITGEFKFVPPDEFICGKYDFLYDRYVRLFDDPEVLEYFEVKNIRITSISMFNSLVMEFNIKIELWNKLKGQLLKEKAVCESPKYTDVYVQKDVKLVTFELQKLLLDHQKRKIVFTDSLIMNRQQKVAKYEKKFNSKIVAIDINRAKLLLFGHKYDIQPKTREFIFLKALLEHPNVVIEYRKLAELMALNAYTSTASDEDIANAVIKIKTVLRLKLTDLGVDLRLINKLLNQIVAVRKSGFMFKPLG